MRFSSLRLFALGSLALGLLAGCGKDSNGTGPTGDDVIIPVQINANVGSVFTYSFTQYDSAGVGTPDDGGDITLSAKNATHAGKSGVNVFAVGGMPVWYYIVDMQDNMWEYIPEVSGTYHYPARWQPLPTGGPGKQTVVIRDTAMSTPGSRIKQSIIYEFVRKEPFMVNGVSHNGSKIVEILLTESTLNGVPFMSMRDTTEKIYLPKLAIMGYSNMIYPYNLGRQEMKMINAVIQ